MSKEKLIDLDRDQLDLLHTILKRHIPGKTVWAYGSRVEWKAGETSDLDLAVFSCDPMEIYDLKEAFEESDLLISVDVMDWESIPDDFKENIRKKYVVLQEKPGKPDGWREVKLGDVVRFQRGHDLPKSKMKKGDVPVAGSNGIIGYHNTATTRAPGITVGRSGNIGAAKLYKTDFWAHNTTLYVKDFFGNDEVFIFYLLQTLDLSGFNSGSAVPTLNRNYIHELDISVPQLHEQKAIAEVLSSLDEKIDLLHRQNGTLEDMAQAIFRKWFVEFNFPIDSLASEQPQAQYDEVTNKSRTEKSPHQSEAKGYRDAGGKMVDSELGRIPARWKVGKLKDIVDLHYGKGLKQSERTGTGYPVVGSSGIVDYHSSCLVNGPGIVIGRKGTLGKTIYLWDNFFPIDTTFYVESKQGSEALLFEYLLLQHIGFKEMNTDSAVPGLNKNIALGNQIVVPSISYIHKFNKEVRPMFNKIHFNQSHASILENQRDTLLPKLMSGKIRVD